MKSRLGSIDIATVLMTLNERLVQIPIQLIDLVIFHELVHLKHPHHKRLFYDELLLLSSSYKEGK